MKHLLLVILLAALPAHAQKPVDESWHAKSVEVTVPAVVTAGEEFSVVYRATPKSGVRLEATFGIKSKTGVVGQGRITDTPISFAARVRRGVIDAPGYYVLTFEFKNAGDKILKATARTKVLSASEKTVFTGTAWDWPRKNLYLSAQPFASWNEVPVAEREILGLERVSFSPLLEQPDHDNSWWPLRAWNELYEILQPQFIPPLEFVRAFKNTSYNPITHVSYATWSQNGVNFVYQSEIGSNAWFYIETPAPAKPADLNSIFALALLKPPIQGNASASNRSLLARSMVRARALTADSPSEAVHVWLVQIRRGELDLRFPGYRAPLSPRLSSTP